MPEKFEDLAWHEHEGVPVLDDTVATIVCTLEDDVAGGDHRVVVGRVVDGELHRSASRCCTSAASSACGRPAGAADEPAR